MVKNSNWHEADQLATCICKRGHSGQGVELGATKNQHPLAVRTGLEPRISGC